MFRAVDMYRQIFVYGYMKKSFLFIFVIALLLLSFSDAAVGDPGTITLDDFSKSKLGGFPKGWRTWPFQRGKCEKVYKIGEEDGHKFISAYDPWDISQQIFLNFHWPVEKRPILSWKWRATTLPEGGIESDDNKNDSACGLYIVVGKYQGHAIKYVWSTTLKPGTVVTRKDGKLKIKVIDSGPDKKGKWVSHSVNVLSDYKALFGGELKKNPSGIAILSDGNAVHKPAGCDYMDFAISTK